VQPDGTNNFYDSTQMATDKFNSIVNRYDFNLSDRQRLTGKWYWNHRTRTITIGVTPLRWQV